MFQFPCIKFLFSTPELHFFVNFRSSSPGHRAIFDEIAPCDSKMYNVTSQATKLALASSRDKFVCFELVVVFASLTEGLWSVITLMIHGSPYTEGCNWHKIRLRKELEVKFSVFDRTSAIYDRGREIQWNVAPYWFRPLFQGYCFWTELPPFDDNFNFYKN